MFLYSYKADIFDQFLLYFYETRYRKIGQFFGEGTSNEILRNVAKLYETRRKFTRYGEALRESGSSPKS